MARSFEVVLRVMVYDLNEEETEWLESDPGDFLLESELLDNVEFDSMTEIR